MSLFSYLAVSDSTPVARERKQFEQRWTKRQSFEQFWGLTRWGVKYSGTPGDLKARQPEAVRTLLRTMVVEMWAQSGATTVTDMTSIVPTVGHHECKNVEFQKGESDELGHVTPPGKGQICPFDLRPYLPKLCTGKHPLKEDRGGIGKRWIIGRGQQKKWQMSSTWLLHSSLWVEAGLLQMGEISHQWFV